MMLLAELAGKLGNDDGVEKLQKVSTKRKLNDYSSTNDQNYRNLIVT